eukprot:TRINITY_DN67561_c6_g1_i2.p1 TRINITY_DN67561_c6_g1~~TRINITY_DN67561_c6_g1_i2.p1  ORF type:complete len:480 (+),score=22.19 TRINITY_DN67561_c6_g1_i2:42-1481(+)
MAVVNAYDVNLHFKGKSNREIYQEACAFLGFKKGNSELLGLFDTRKDNLFLKEIRIEDNYIGDRGTQALLPVIQANKVLRSIVLPQQSLTDETIDKLLLVIREHPRITELDISGNTEVTTKSGHGIIRLVSDNKMLSKVNCRNTSIGTNIIKKIEQLAKQNGDNDTNFFQSNYFRFRKVFQTLDTNKHGRVSTNDILQNIEIPQVADHLMEKFASMQTGVLSSTDEVSLNVNEFLYFTYPDFISHYEIVEQASKEESEEETIVKNWENMQIALGYLHLLCPDYKAICIRDQLLSDQQWKTACDLAFKLQTTANPGEYNIQTDSATCRHVVTALSLKEGLRAVYTFPRRPKPKGTQQWKMAPNLLKKVTALWRDGDDYKVERKVSIKDLLPNQVETNLVRLEPSLLTPKFPQHDLPEDLEIGLEEWVNLLEEYYDEIATPLAGIGILSQEEQEQFTRPPTPKTPRTPRTPKSGQSGRRLP